MSEAFVQLSCPECMKDWQDAPMDLPAPDAEFTCPDCDETRSTAEFMRTDRDLEILRDLKEV